MEIKELIRKISRGESDEIRSLVCRVISVDKANYQCDLQPVDGSADLKSVRLSATEALNATMVIIPTRGSYVIATMLNNNDAFVSLTDEADDIEILNHGRLIIHNEDDIDIHAGGKMTVKNDQASVKEILNDLISELKLAIIQTPAGAGNFSPATTAKLDVIDNKINQLFNA
jgi:hypothetical protein